MDQKSEQRFGIYVFLGLAIGALLGLGLGTVSRNPIAGLVGGVVAGVFVGWFIAAAVMEKEKKQKDK